MSRPIRRRPRWPFPPIRLASLLAVALVVGCASDKPLADPIATLTSTESTPTQQERAMAALDQEPPDDAYIQALRRLLYQPGYTVRVREAALDRLLAIDPDAALRTLEVQMPRLTALDWRRRLCAIVVERDWKDMTPTLVRAWAAPMPGWVDRDDQRPERIALEKLYGKSGVPDVLFTLFVESNGVTQQNLRARCWELLIALGQRDRLVALLADTEVAPNDATLADLRVTARDLGVIPVNREEILWVRKLREPARAAYWSQAREAVAALGPEQRSNLELRDLAVVVALAQVDPALLQATRAELEARIESYLASPAAGSTHRLDFAGWSGAFPQLFSQWRAELKWTDLAAIVLAIDALQTPEVRSHLFDYADRDLKDRTTEYGGIIRLDEQGRFEVVEFRPRIKGNDERFEAPQDMLDAGYTGLFHFHFHATSRNNARYAAPAQGDTLYADSVRNNALCFTFIDGSRLNVDFYRHGGVSVDLGEIQRP
ncbi:MAG: hypothetical protein KDA22_16530 [Phycisphaerales bacterium]|nr:hypothetical protein [Phycisphaerales bacterium]